jgi:hypothetical protein
VRPFLSQADTERLFHAFITSRHDYCNALLSGLPKKANGQLQNIQNAAARTLTKTRRRAHITPVLRSLHWLPVSFRIHFKILLLVFKIYPRLYTSIHVRHAFKLYTPSRSLRSSGTGLLTIPKPRTKRHSLVIMPPAFGIACQRTRWRLKLRTYLKDILKHIF